MGDVKGIWSRGRDGGKNADPLAVLMVRNGDSQDGDGMPIISLRFQVN